MVIFTERKRSASSMLLSSALSFIRRFDWIQILPMLVLLTFGVLFIYSTGQQVGGYAADSFWKKQIQWIAIGLLVWFVISMIDYRIFGPATIVIYPVTLILLGYVLLVGKEIYGAKRWIDLGPASLQPSELGKLVVLLASAWLLSFKEVDINKPQWMLALAAIIAPPFLLTLIEPDLGSSLVIIPIAGAIAFAAKLKWRFIILATILTLASMPVAYHFLHEYQKQRILVFLDPERDPQNRGWNQLQAEMAVGSGGLTGKGFMQGTQNTLGFLPQTVSNTDFIISVIAEETGFVGSATIIFMYLLLIASALRTAFIAPDEFGRLLCIGAAAIFFTHSIINMGMSIRLMPVTGIPLPLVSYGGSFMVAMMSYLGIIQSVYARRNSYP